MGSRLGWTLTVRALRQRAQAEHGEHHPAPISPHAPRVYFPRVGSHSPQSRMESKASQADTHVAHEPLHLASQPTATALEKGKSRIALGTPASVTTIAADMRDLSRERTHLAPSLSILSPVRAAMQQLDYRFSELEILQTDPASSSSNQPTTTELQLHQEIQQLAHQL